MIYDSCVTDVAAGNIDSSFTYYLMLVTSGYTANKGTHTHRDNVTNEVTGAGYTAGGKAVTLTAATNTTTHKITWTFSTVDWPASTITARGGVIYNRRGGAPGADELVAHVDFGGDVTTTGATFEVTFADALTFDNSTS